MVLLHGTSARWQTFLPVLPLLGWRYRVYAVDLRGHGGSGHTPGAYELEDYGRDIVDFLREEVREPAAVLGHSLGADVAWWVAAQAPDRVRAVVLEEPAVYLMEPGRYYGTPIHQLLSSVYMLRRSHATVDALAAGLQALLPERDALGVRGWAKSLSGHDPEATGTELAEGAWAQVRPDELLPKITAPVLLLQGNPELGSILEERDVARYQTWLAQCTLVRRQDFGHNLHSVAPMAYFQIVSSFLETLD